MAGSFWLWFFGGWVGLGAVTWTAFVVMRLRIEERSSSRRRTQQLAVGQVGAPVAGFGGKRELEAKVPQEFLS